MRICNVIEEGKFGGPQSRMALVAHALDRDAETIIVMPVDNSELFQNKCTELSIRFEAIPLSRITKEKSVAARYVFGFFKEIKALMELFKRIDCDLVHISGGSWQFKGVIAGRLSRKTVLWHLNDTSMPGFIRLAFRTLSRLADGYIFASERSRAYYGGLVSPSKPQFLIPAPVDTSRFKPDLTTEFNDEDKERWPGKIVVGLVGNINRVKGIETFIRMAGEVNSSLNNIQFVIVGPVFDNQRLYFDSLRDLISEIGDKNIEFLGGREDVRPLLKRFDIYVCSSNAESSPMSVWEAMAMELPVVSTDVGDVPLYVKNGETGYIAPVGDHNTLARYVCKLADDECLRARLGKAARAQVVDELDIKACAAKHLHAYRAMLERP